MGHNLCTPYFMLCSPYLPDNHLIFEVNYYVSWVLLLNPFMHSVKVCLKPNVSFAKVEAFIRNPFVHQYACAL